MTPIIVPDSEAMRRQLEHVFLGDLDGAHDGLIELAWNDARTGALSAAELFGTDRIDDLVDRAVALTAIRRSSLKPSRNAGRSRSAFR